MAKVFKDVMNRWMTSGLFHETATKDTTPLYTLEEARKTFVDLGDMTGYKFSQKMLGGYAHWKALEASGVMSNHIEDWREELEVKLRCEGLERIVSESEEGHYQANKFLVDRGWDTRAAGRPSKLEVEKKVTRDAKVVEAGKRFLSPIR
jgi:hypothetical protein